MIKSHTIKNIKKVTILEKQDIELIKNSIRTIKDWPEKGVIFRDITTLLQNPIAFQKVIQILVDRYRKMQINIVAGLDARGFIFGPIIAYELGLGFIPIRKKGKLPFNTYKESYTLEYGESNIVEVHTDAIKKNDKVILVDDLIATGGTMIAGCKLIEKLGGKVVECAVVNDLQYLNGSNRLKALGYNLFTILEYNQ